MNIDRDKVQKLINETIGSQYIIHTLHETKKFIFINWKHKDYELDDERGHRIGVGPVVFNKLTKEYKLSGSGELISGEYEEIFDDSNENNEQEFKTPSILEIKAGILRRQYVNSDDIGFLGINLEKEIGNLQYSQTWIRELVDYSNYAVIETNNQIAFDRTIEFWKEIGFQYNVISESELFVWRIKTT